MTLAQTIIVLTWLVNVGVPLLVALLTASHASSTVKAIANIVLSLVGSALVSIVGSLVAGRPIGWFDLIFAFVTGFVVSAGSYAHIWKPTGVAPTLALRGASLGE